MTGAAPVPVPPPRPVVTNTMSAPLSTSRMRSVSSSAAARPTFGSAPGAEALGQLRADLHAHRGGVVLQRLLVGVRDDELDAAQSGERHAIDGIAAAAADANHLDAGTGADDVLVQEDSELIGTVGLEVASIHVERSFPGA